jgi:hypothetical protein
MIFVPKNLLTNSGEKEEAQNQENRDSLPFFYGKIMKQCLTVKTISQGFVNEIYRLVRGKKRKTTTFESDISPFLQVFYRDYH